MLRFTLLRTPLLAYVVLAAALAAGDYAHWRSPMGVFLYTPRDWCLGRTHAFGLTYLSVLCVFAMGCVLGWLGCFVARAFSQASSTREKLEGLARKALVSVAIFAMAMLATPVFELAMPLQKDPLCISPVPPRSN